MTPRRVENMWHVDRKSPHLSPAATYFLQITLEPSPSLGLHLRREARVSLREQFSRLCPGFDSSAVARWTGDAETMALMTH